MTALSHPIASIEKLMIFVVGVQLYDNGVAGIHITGSNNFTFEATVDSIGDVGEGNVGSIDGQQPIEIIIETSSLLTFQDMRVQSVNGKARPLLMIWHSFS